MKENDNNKLLLKRMSVERLKCEWNEYWIFEYSLFVVVQR